MELDLSLLLPHLRPGPLDLSPSSRRHCNPYVKNFNILEGSCNELARTCGFCIFKRVKACRLLIVGCAETALRLNLEDRGDNVLPLCSQSKIHHDGDDDKDGDLDEFGHHFIQLEIRYNGIEARKQLRKTKKDGQNM